MRHASSSPSMCLPTLTCLSVPLHAVACRAHEQQIKERILIKQQQRVDQVGKPHPCIVMLLSCLVTWDSILRRAAMVTS